MGWLEDLLAADFAAREANRQMQMANAAAAADPNSAYNQRIAAAEAAAAEQNQFSRDITRGGLDVQRGNLDVNRQNAKTSRYSAETGRYSAETDRAYREALVKQAAEDLAFRYHQQAQEFQLGQGKLGLDTLSLGAGLRGVRDWDSYLNTVGMAGQNPILQGAMGAWADLTNNRPRGTGAYQGPAPQRFDLNALASDFMGQGVQGTTNGPNRNPFLDEVARGSAAPGWWTSLGSDMQQRALGYWENTGQSPATILNKLAYQAPNQGLSFGGI